MAGRNGGASLADNRGGRRRVGVLDRQDPPQPVRPSLCTHVLRDGFGPVQRDLNAGFLARCTGSGAPFRASTTESAKTIFMRLFVWLCGSEFLCAETR